MGQMTYAVLYGCEMDEDPPELFADGWYTLFEAYKQGKGPEPSMNENADKLGFWVAGSEDDGVPELEEFPLDGIREVKAYAKRIAACERAWPKFEAHARKMGVTLGKPRLWVVETGVA